MPETKPSTLPDVPADPSVFGQPTNDRPTIQWPDPVPRDSDRVRHVSEGATHVVIAEHFGTWERGDKIKEDDLPEGGHTLEDLDRIKPYPPVRPLRDDERPRAEEVTKHDPKARAQAEREAKVKADSDAKAVAEREAKAKADADAKALALKEKALAEREKALAEKEAQKASPVLSVEPPKK